MTVLADQIVAQLAELERVAPEPTEPFAYGTDTWCEDEIEANWADVEPTSTLAIGQALYRRLTTRPGGLIEDPDYGTDIRALLNHGSTQAGLRAIEGKVKNECSKDDRVASLVVSALFAAETRTLTLRIEVTPEDPRVRTFTMTLACTDGATMLEAIS